MSTKYHTVHVRVNDAATGQPTPVRIRFTGPDGTRAHDANELITNGPYDAVDVSASGGSRYSTYYASALGSKEISENKFQNHDLEFLLSDLSLCDPRELCG